MKGLNSWVTLLSTLLLQIIFSGNSVNFMKETYPNLKLARISKYPSLPNSPIKPKKTLIVLLGGVLGGMLGVFIALVVPARKETVSA